MNLENKHGIGKHKNKWDMHPELKLWSYCLIDAIVAASRGTHEAIRWFEEERETTGGYGWVCEQLGFSKQFRAKLARVRVNPHGVRINDVLREF